MGENVLSIADTSAQDVQLAPQDPRRKRLIVLGIAVVSIALIAALIAGGAIIGL